MPATSSPPTFYTLPGGGRLRGDAAASVLRMRAAGMPAGGVDVYSRTLAQQRVLYDRFLRGGPLAAKPSARAPHVRGVAMDLQTTRGGLYNPSAAHVWMTTGGVGQSPPKPGERLRCHPYGWRRTVPSERWHYAYEPARDARAKADLTARLKALGYRDVRAFQRSKGLTVDGVAGPQTWTALLLAGDTAPKPIPPKPVPPKPVDPSAVMVLGVANCQSYDGQRSEDSYRARARIMASKGWTVAAVCETTEDGREWMLDELHKVTGHRWRRSALVSKSVAVLWDDATWSWRPWRSKVFPGSRFGHGVRVVPLVHRKTGRGVDVGSLHVRPKSIATGAEKDADIAVARRTAGDWPMVLAGDYARQKPTMPGWRLATPRVDTMDADGDQTVDAAYVRGAIIIGDSAVVDPGPLSDHKWLTVHLALPDPKGAL